VYEGIVDEIKAFVTGQKREVKYRYVDGYPVHHLWWDGDWMVYTLWATDVVRYNPSTKELCIDTGGWHTPTTRNAINAFLTQLGIPIRIYSCDIPNVQSCIYIYGDRSLAELPMDDKFCFPQDMYSFCYREPKSGRVTLLKIFTNIFDVFGVGGKIVDVTTVPELNMSIVNTCTKIPRTRAYIGNIWRFAFSSITPLVMSSYMIKKFSSEKSLSLWLIGIMLFF